MTSVCQALHDNVTKCVCDVSKPASDGGVSDVIIITLPSTLGFVCVCVCDINIVVGLFESKHLTPYVLGWFILERELIPH